MLELIVAATGERTLRAGMVAVVQTAREDHRERGPPGRADLEAVS